MAVELLRELLTKLPFRNVTYHSCLFQKPLWYRPFHCPDCTLSHQKYCLNQPLPSRHTLLTAALRARNVKDLKFLLEHGADPDLASVSGKAPLLMAVENSQWQAMDCLLAARHRGWASRYDLAAGSLLLWAAAGRHTLAETWRQYPGPRSPPPDPVPPTAGYRTGGDLYNCTEGHGVALTGPRR